MPQTKNTIPRELREHGIAAVHPYPSCANEDSHIVRRFDSAYAFANYPQARATAASRLRFHHPRLRLYRGHKRNTLCDSGCFQTKNGEQLIP